MFPFTRAKGALSYHLTYIQCGKRLQLYVQINFIKENIFVVVARLGYQNLNTKCGKIRWTFFFQEKNTSSELHFAKHFVFTSGQAWIILKGRIWNFFLGGGRGGQIMIRIRSKSTPIRNSGEYNYQTIFKTCFSSCQPSIKPNFRQKRKKKKQWWAQIKKKKNLDYKWKK